MKVTKAVAVPAPLFSAPAGRRGRINLPPAASVPRPVCHGTGAFPFSVHPSLCREAPFKPLSRHNLAVGKTDGCGIPRSALTRYRTRRTGSVRQGTVSR
ncbi:hypothetical protein S828_13850 [Salmonella enterica]|nr:hypothetical protein [Salmonella enterica]